MRSQHTSKLVGYTEIGEKWADGIALGLRYAIQTFDPLDKRIDHGSHTIAHSCSKEDTAFIVRVINSHEALLNACKKTLDFIQRSSEGIALDVKDSLRLAIKSAIVQAEVK